MVELIRATSTIPVSTHQVESTVIPLPIQKAWGIFKQFHLEKVIPGKVKSTTFVTGGANQLDSVIKIDYNDGANWQIRVVEISDLRHSIGYEVISTEPAHTATSIQGYITLRSVTDDGTTFLEWQTDFSNDADAGVIADQKYKKLEFFAEIKKNLSGAGEK